MDVFVYCSFTSTLSAQRQCDATRHAHMFAGNQARMARHPPLTAAALVRVNYSMYAR